MSLRYDFDMVSVAEGAEEAGAGPVALFRDPATAEALCGAGEQVQALFLASGFGLTTRESDLPDGQYLGADEPGRIDVIERLGRNLPRFKIAGEKMNGFDFEAFMIHLSLAEPIEGRPPAPQAPRGAHGRVLGAGLLAAGLAAMSVCAVYLTAF